MKLGNTDRLCTSFACSGRQNVTELPGTWSARGHGWFRSSARDSSHVSLLRVTYLWYFLGTTSFLPFSVAFSPSRAWLCVVTALEIRRNIVQCVRTCSKLTFRSVVLVGSGLYRIQNLQVAKNNSFPSVDINAGIIWPFHVRYRVISFVTDLTFSTCCVYLCRYSGGYIKTYVIGSIILS